LCCLNVFKQNSKCKRGVSKSMWTTGSATPATEDELDSHKLSSDKRQITRHANAA